MQHFVELYLVLAGNAPEHSKRAALERYFRAASPADAAWAAFMLTGRHTRRVVSSTRLRSIAASASDLPEWLFAASHAVTRDVAETAALMVGPASGEPRGTLAEWMEERIGPLAGLPPSQVETRLRELWAQLGPPARWVLNRVLTATLRAPHGDTLVSQALGAMMDVPQPEMAERIAGPWEPSVASWAALTAPAGVQRHVDASIPAEGTDADAHRVNAVLLYAEPGTGRHASLHAACTFGVWHEHELVPFAKAYAVLSHDDARALDAWIRANTRERFGPVRSVEPVLVFELAFDAVERSRRHKCGLVLRGARVMHWDRNRSPNDAGSLAALAALAGETPREDPGA